MFFQVYPMHSKPRGYCFIINNVQFINNIERTRTGAEVDGKNLHDLFEQFGYIVESHRDQGLEVIVSAILHDLEALQCGGPGPFLGCCAIVAEAAAAAAVVVVVSAIS
jgi:hypothetical protein